MTDKTHTPTSDAATLATTQPTAPVATEDTPMTEPKAAAPDPKVAASETRAQPKMQTTPAPDTEAVATRAREAERDRVSTIYDLAGRLNLERGFAEDLVKRASAGGDFAELAREHSEAPEALQGGSLGWRTPDRLPELPKDQPVYVICQAGGRSAQATELMRAVGIDATSVTDGTGAWIEAGRPVESAT